MKTIKDWLLVGMGMALATLLAIDLLGRPPKHAPAPAPAGVQAAALGRGYGPQVISSLADAWVAAADALAKGKNVGEARDVLHAAWQEARTKVFAATVAPEFSKVLAEGTDPKDETQRGQVVALWREFARGLRGGR